MHRQGNKDPFRNEEVYYFSSDVFRYKVVCCLSSYPLNNYSYFWMHNTMIETITFEDMIVAIIIRADFKKNGIEFFTPEHFSQQLGYMNRAKGYIVEPHIHERVERKVTLTQEVLYIKSGKIKVGLFDNNHVLIGNRTLLTGDIILLSTGGHSVEWLEDSEIIEIKQGPYAGYSDKIKITPKIKE